MNALSPELLSCGHEDSVIFVPAGKKDFVFSARVLTPSPPSLLQGRGNGPEPSAFVNILLGLAGYSPQDGCAAQ